MNDITITRVSSALLFFALHGVHKHPLAPLSFSIPFPTASTASHELFVGCFL